jgi:elongation factor P
MEVDRGMIIVLDKQPYKIIKADHMFKGRGSSVTQAKLKNLKTGNVIAKTFRSSDNIEEADIERNNVKFIYENRGTYTFSADNNPSDRFELSEEQIRDVSKFLKPNMIVEAVVFNEEVINIVLPIKVIYKVIEAAPGVQGDRSSAGNKMVKIETGANIDVPLFIVQDDMIEINTESGEYCRRVNE